MLATATNDGQMHFFDAGKYIQIDDEELGEVEVFTDGSGYELFSYMPRMAMPIVRDQADGERHIFSLDGTPRIDDVFIDPVPDESGDYSPVQREWRTVMVAGMREAGDTFNSPTDVADFESGYFALDITYPDAVVQPTSELGAARPFAPYVPVNPGKFLPDCLNVDDDSGRQEAVDTPECRSLSGELTPFPMELWIFQDTVQVGGTNYFVDDDQNGFRDLGATWSVPVIGQIAVCKEGGTQCAANSLTASGSDDVETRWVAIFGGGLDPANINNPQRGNWIYMVDMETGQAIYRRQVDGAVPSDPAVLDVDSDGVIDRVYFGTTAGTMYKIDLTATDGGDVPSLTTESLADDNVLGWTAAAGEDDTVDVLRVTSSAWEPFPIFNTGSPIYYPPSLFRVPELQQFGLAFGVGAREDLWEESGFDGGFFVIVDQDFTDSTTGIPFNRDDLVQFDWQEEDPINSGTAIDAIDATGNLLLLDFASTGFRPGWMMQFPADFKTTSEAFVLSTILVLSVFDPLTITVDVGGDSDAVCAQTGPTYSFVISLLNGRGIAPLDEGESSPCG
ncbi:MAG: PilC/PilY family type IV pilus protein, partial [Acidobacteriota bacterium]